MEAMKVFLLGLALGVSLVLSAADLEDDNDDGSDDYEEASGENEDQSTRTTPVNNSSSLPSSAAKHSPQRGAVANLYSLCLVSAIVPLCTKA